MQNASWVFPVNKPLKKKTQVASAQLTKLGSRNFFYPLKKTVIRIVEKRIGGMSLGPPLFGASEAFCHNFGGSKVISLSKKVLQSHIWKPVFLVPPFTCLPSIRLSPIPSPSPFNGQILASSLPFPSFRLTCSPPQTHLSQSRQ